MRFGMITADVAAFSVVVMSVMNIVPAIAGVLAVIYYSFLIYDRIRYGPDLDGRVLRKRVTTVETVQTPKPESTKQ